MEQRLRARLLIEQVLAVVSALLCLLTLAYPEWIEASTGLEPDAGSGEAEWIVAVAFLVVAVASGLLARRDHSRLAFDNT
jgi:hypothetical protein